MLNTEDIQTINRPISMGTGYLEGERFTLQHIEVLEASRRPTVEQWCQVGRDAAFSSNTNTAKPSGVLLHFNYGAAAVKWWGHNTDTLRSQNPPHAAPAPRRCQQPQPPPSPAAGPSTDVPAYLRRPLTTINHERNLVSQEHKQHSANERVNESKAWESWDEDDWMMFCRFNTKAVHGRLQAAGEESSSNIRAWAQEVSDYQTTEH